MVLFSTLQCDVYHWQMTQEERWLIKCNEVMDFIKTNHRNPSRHDPEERYKYLNWIKHNRKQMNAGTLKQERIERFKKLLGLIEENKRVNQWV